MAVGNSETNTYFTVAAEQKTRSAKARLYPCGSRSNLHPAPKSKEQRRAEAKQQLLQLSHNAQAVAAKPASTSALVLIAAAAYLKNDPVSILRGCSSYLGLCISALFASQGIFILAFPKCTSLVLFCRWIGLALPYVAVGFMCLVFEMWSGGLLCLDNAPGLRRLLPQKPQRILAILYLWMGFNIMGRAPPALTQAAAYLAWFAGVVKMLVGDTSQPVTGKALSTASIDSMRRRYVDATSPPLKHSPIK